MDGRVHFHQVRSVGCTRALNGLVEVTQQYVERLAHLVTEQCRDPVLLRLLPRSLPQVKNGVKVFSMVRVRYVRSILAIWAGHHLWQEIITFMERHNYKLVHCRSASHSAIGMVSSMANRLRAAVKSA